MSVSTNSPTPDATTLVKGKVQLAGDLGGTAALPSVLKISGVTISNSPAGSGQALVTTSTSAASWTTLGGGTGTVTSVSIVAANGFAGSVATATTTPAITLTTSITGILKGNGTAISAASAGTDYEVPLTFSTGLTRSTNTITVNTSQNISTLSNLTSNGILTTSGGTGALSITGTNGTGNVVLTTSPTLVTPTLGVATATRLGIGAAADASKMLYVVGDVTNGIATIERTNTSTNAQLGTAIIKATSSGDMTDGFGAAFQFAIQDNAAVENLIGYVATVRNGADNTGRMNLGVYSAGTGIIGASVFPTALTSGANDTSSLGTTALQWSDLFLASGAVVNWSNGDVALTHSTGILTLGTGDLRVTTAGANTASVVTVGGTQTLTGKTLTSPSITGATITTSTVNGVTLTTGGGTTNFLRADGTYAAPGGGGSGDVVGPASATNNAVALFDLTTGKLLKNSSLVYTGSNLAGVSTIGGNPIPAGDFVGTTDTQTLSAKTLTTPRIASMLDASGNATLDITSPSAGLTLLDASGTNNFRIAPGTGGSARLSLVDGADNTKQVTFNSSGATTATSTTLVFTNTTNKTVTFQDVTGTVLVTNGTDVAVADGGTGRSTSTTAYGLIAAGTTATGAHQTLAAGLTTQVLVGGGASALPVWTTVTGTGSPVLATSPSLTTPIINQFGTASGLGAAWSTWIPTWTNLTIGNAVVTARYMQIGKTVFCFLRVAFGTTSVMGTAPTFSLPVTAAAGYNSGFNVLTTGYAEDLAVAGYNIVISINSSVTVGFLTTMAVGGVYASMTSGVTSATPFVWGNGDYFTASFTYEAA